MPIASRLRGSQFSEQSPPLAHAPRAVPQPHLLLPDCFPQAQLAWLVGPLQARLHDHGLQDAHSTVGRLWHGAQKANNRGLAEVSMQDLKNGALEDPGTKHL